jgi:hypothetical protein
MHKWLRCFDATKNGAEFAISRGGGRNRRQAEASSLCVTREVRSHDSVACRITDCALCPSATRTDVSCQ